MTLKRIEDHSGSYFEGSFKIKSLLLKLTKNSSTAGYWCKNIYNEKQVHEEFKFSYKIKI